MLTRQIFPPTVSVAARRGRPVFAPIIGWGGVLETEILSAFQSETARSPRTSSRSRASRSTRAIERREYGKVNARRRRARLRASRTEPRVVVVAVAVARVRFGPRKSFFVAGGLRCGSSHTSGRRRWCRPATPTSTTRSNDAIGAVAVAPFAIFCRRPRRRARTPSRRLKQPVEARSRGGFARAVGKRSTCFVISTGS